MMGGNDVNSAFMDAALTVAVGVVVTLVTMAHLSWPLIAAAPLFLSAMLVMGILGLLLEAWAKR
jgi:hypothetical protein